MGPVVLVDFEQVMDQFLDRGAIGNEAAGRIDGPGGR